MAFNTSLKDLVHRYNSRHQSSEPEDLHTNSTDLPPATPPADDTTSNFTKALHNESLATGSPSFPSHDGPSDVHNDSSITTKITLLLLVTAVMLIASYKFMVRLFLGYSDRKDDVLPEGFSEDEDSAVIKRIASPHIEIG